MDIEIIDHIIVAGRTGETFSIREKFPDIFDKNTYANTIVRVADGVEEQLSVYDTGKVAKYELFQIKRGSNGDAYRFKGMDFANEKKLIIDREDYESVYKGELKSGESLDTLYEKFNLYHPKDFRGHSMSVSDVVVIEDEKGKKAYYVNSFGFCELPQFLRHHQFV